MAQSSRPHDSGDVKPDAKTIFINARLIDPASGKDEPGGLLVIGEKIADFGAHLRRNAPEGATVVDCKGHVLAPGLIDAQVFTGEPGEEHRETLRTAGEAAAAGGVTTMIVMPDTKPVIDDVALVDFIGRRGRDRCPVHARVMAGVTKGLNGKELSEIGLLKRTGAVAFTNGKASIIDSKVMRNALLYARDHDVLICHHTEDPFLSNGAVMNSGEVATRLGLPGVHKLAETMMLERDLRLVDMTNARYHASTISCAESLSAIRTAKAKKQRVSCGVSINHLTLNENDIGSYRTFLRVKPPLRTEDDRVAMVRGIANGDIDIIVSSHDPQDADVKRQPFAEASDGALGLETLLSAALRIYHAGEVPLVPLLRAMTSNPAKLFNLENTGRLEKGCMADLVLFDLDRPWVVDKATLRSRSKNTPHDEAKMTGRALMTMVGGRIVFGREHVPGQG
jgi:dihydroorotase